MASWLTDVAQSFGRKPPPQAQAVADRAKRRLKNHCWQHIGNSVHAVAFKQWLVKAVEAGFEDRVAVHWLRSSASLVADRAAAHDKRLADAAWRSWINDGPAKSLGRWHRMTKVASGWIPSATRLTDDMREDHNDDESPRSILSKLSVYHYLRSKTSTMKPRDVQPSVLSKQIPTSTQ